MAHSREDSKKKTQTFGKILTSGMSGVAELLLFHPVDTTIKRLQNNRTQIIRSNLSWNQNFFEFCSVATKGTYKPASLYQGLGSGLIYKVAQRSYKYTVQDALSTRLKKATSTEGQKVLAEAASGAAVGALEAVLLPLDAIKIFFQTNGESVKNKSITSVLVGQNVKLYRGFWITAARNTAGSFALFGGNQVVRNYILKLKDDDKSGLSHHFIAGVGGSIPSLIVSSPFDVIKTRINASGGEQLRDGKTERLKARHVFKDILVHEGPRAFTKGLATKLLTVGPKLTFSMGFANFLMERSDTILQEMSLFTNTQVAKLKRPKISEEDKKECNDANSLSKR